jgi:hypothetical protein
MNDGDPFEQPPMPDPSKYSIHARHPYLCSRADSYQNIYSGMLDDINAEAWFVVYPQDADHRGGCYLEVYSWDLCADGDLVINEEVDSFDEAYSILKKLTPEDVRQVDVVEGDE